MIAELIITTFIALNPFNSATEPFTSEVDYIPLGTYEITAYGYSEGYGENYKTASGKTPEPYYTVAVDTDQIPMGTHLYIEGVGEVEAQDTGGAVKGDVIDLHVGYDNCDAWGRQKRMVYIERL